MRNAFLVLLLAFAFPLHAADALSEAGSARGKVTLKWLGITGWEIRTGETIILIDPFLTRKDRSKDADWKTDEDAVLKVITGADFIFAGHSHHDHIGDVPFIAKRFRSKIIGSGTTAKRALAAGVDKSQMIVIRGGEKLDFKHFSVEVIESRHGLSRGRASRTQNGGGGEFLYYFTFGQRRVLHQSTANFIEEKLAGVRPDLALLAVGHEGYDLERVLKKLQPKAVILQHFDQWRSPFSEGIPAKNMRRARRFARDITAVDDQIEVIIPDFLTTYPLD